jgi:hypothetical protein
MKGVRLYLWSLAISALLVGALAGISSVPYCSFAGMLLLPGGLLAAIVFPQGAESESANSFLILAGLLDTALFALPVMGVWHLFAGKKHEAQEKT